VPETTPSNVIGITPPKYTVIWGKRQFEYDDGDEPEEPIPEEPFPEEPFPEDPFPEEPEDPFPSVPDTKPSNVIGITPPKSTVIWGKRQFEYDDGDDPEEPIPEEPEEPTPEEPFPEDPFPEEPEDPFPSVPDTKPSNVIGITPPKSTVIWGKRQFEYDDGDDPEEPIPEEPFPEDPFPEEPEDPFPNVPDTTPSNVIGITPPKATIIWGKREKASTSNSAGLHFPTYSVSWSGPKPPKTTKPVYVSWGKRQDDEVTLLPPSASISWDKRADAAASDSGGLQFPTYSVSWWKPPPKPTSVSVGWGKRDAEVQLPTDAPPQPTLTLSLWPTPPPVPTTLITPGPKPPITKPVPSGCSTTTVTIARPCVPPICALGGYVPCDYNRAKPVLEKRFITLRTSIAVPTIGKPTPVKPTSVTSCTSAITKTVAVSCPTYTCVPWGSCEAFQVVK
jgi:hypothetical protein